MRLFVWRITIYRKEILFFTKLHEAVIILPSLQINQTLEQLSNLTKMAQRTYAKDTTQTLAFR